MKQVVDAGSVVPIEDLVTLAADPTRVAEVPREALPDLLAQLEALRARMWLRMAGQPSYAPPGTLPANGARVGRHYRRWSNRRVLLDWKNCRGWVFDPMANGLWVGQLLPDRYPNYSRRLGGPEKYGFIGYGWVRYAHLGIDRSGSRPV